MNFRVFDQLKPFVLRIFLHLWTGHYHILQFDSEVTDLWTDVHKCHPNVFRVVRFWELGFNS